MALKVNYKDSTSNGKKKYTLTPNGDGTYSIEDVTNYTQVGDNFSASDINSTNAAVNKNTDDNKTMAEDLKTTKTSLETLTTSFNELKNAFDALGLCVIDGKVCQKVKVNE